MKKTFCLVILLAFITLNANAQQKPSFIPQPDNVAWMEGSFLIDKKLSLSIESATLRPAADYLSEIIAKSTGITPRMKKRGGTIRLALADNIAAGGYMLNISPKLITITGGDYQGVVAGISTLRQIAPLSSPEGDTSAFEAIEAPSGAVGGAVAIICRSVLIPATTPW